MKFFSLLIVTSLFTLAACGGGKSGNGQHTVSPVEHKTERQDDIGHYGATLAPLNTTLSGNTSGIIEVTIAGDSVVVESTVTGAPAGVKHLQTMMTGSRCPEMSADKDADGLLSMTETAAIVGNIFIPLDSNLREQIAGMDYGPIANGEGEYIYRRSVSLATLLADLRAPDPDTQDNVVKLPLDQDLNLAGRVVLVQGVEGDQTLPIACGVLERIGE